MHALRRAPRLRGAIELRIYLDPARLFFPSDCRSIESAHLCIEGCQSRSFFSSTIPSLRSAGLVHGNGPPPVAYSFMSRLSFCSGAGIEKEGCTEAVKQMYDKILESINSKRTMAPNAWTWSMIENCKSREDIELLFDVLQNLRRFRLSNLRIHENFNCNLCREVAKACVRVGALDYGKKTLWKHNVHGLTPTIGSAHHLLQHAKEHKDTVLLQEVMRLMKRNDLPLQPGTADIVFRICYDTDNWELLTKCSKRFVRNGVKLHKAAFDIWMDFAAKMGDVESLWKIEKSRSDSVKQHSLGSAFSCAKGFLLEGKPEEAAAIISTLNQSLPETKRPGIVVELQRLISDWPLEVIKRRKEEDRKALASSLKADIPAMISALLSTGLKVTVNMEDLSKTEDLLV